MYVSRVVINGVRGFHGPRSVDLTLTRPDGTHAGWTVLAGRNGSGKSTLLRAIALALVGPARSLQLLPESTQWVSDRSKQGSVELELELNTDWDRLKPPGRSPAGNRFWVGVTWRSLRSDDSHASGLRVTESRPEPLLKRNKSTARRMADRATWADTPIGLFYAAYGPFRRLTGAGSEGQRLMLAPMPVARVVTLFREDSSLAESVSWLQEQHLRRLERRPGAEELVDSVLALLDHGLLPDGFRVDRVDSEGLWVKWARTNLPLQELSDGYRTVSALVVDLARNLSASFEDFHLDTSAGFPRLLHPGVVLIDEVDVHLHVSWQQRIGPWLTRHFPNLQFIVTTHSPYICQAADSSGLIRLAGPTERASPRLLDEGLYRRIIHGTGDDAAISELFGLDSPYSQETRRLRAELTRLEARVALGTASDQEQDRYRDLQLELMSSPLARAEELSEEWP
jgi:hypothetical protein